MILIRRKLTIAIVCAALAICCAGVIAASAKQTVSINFVGDVLLDRGVREQIEKNSYLYPHSEVAEIFKADDLTVANLECPLTEGGSPAFKNKRIVFKADPKNSEALKKSGYDVLCLANNHSMDFLGAGLEDTANALQSQGLEFFGASMKERPPALFIKKNGVKIGFLGYSCFPPEGFLHDSSSWSVAYSRSNNLDELKSEISAAAQSCDVLIVYFHWGNEYSKVVTDTQKKLARAAVDSGAKLVIGSHPHVQQRSEEYRGVPVYYSLGNFVFDKQIQKGTDQGTILQATVGRKGVIDLKEIQVKIIKCQPQVQHSNAN